MSDLTTNKSKRLVVCCDGTWNQLDCSYPTNVVKFARLINYQTQDEKPQIVYYLSGCGTAEDADLIQRYGGGAFGWGIDRIIQEAYRFLCINYNPYSEDEIYLVGFSRGAYIIRCLAGMMYMCGLLKRAKIREIPKAYTLYRNGNIKPNDDAAINFRHTNARQPCSSEKSHLHYLNYRVPIKMLGCWDTVGALGIPDVIPWLPIAKIWNQKYEFYDPELSPIVENAFHAVAIDEKRKSFPSTPMVRNKKNSAQNVQEVLFVGEHGCIGGGTEEYRGLSDYPLQWMMNKAKELGLEFGTDTDEFDIKVDHKTEFDNSVTGIYALGGEELRKFTLSEVAIHRSVIERMKDCPDYQPPNLDRNLLLNTLI